MVNPGDPGHLASMWPRAQRSASQLSLCNAAAVPEGTRSNMAGKTATFKMQSGCTHSLHLVCRVGRKESEHTLYHNKPRRRLVQLLNGLVAACADDHASLPFANERAHWKRNFAPEIPTIELSHGELRRLLGLRSAQFPTRRPGSPCLPLRIKKPTSLVLVIREIPSGSLLPAAGVCIAADDKQQNHGKNGSNRPDFHGILLLEKR